MKKNRCPECGVDLPLDAINLAEGVSLCPACGVLSRLSTVADMRRPKQEILGRIPHGCKLEDWGNRIVIRATLRSAGGFLGILFLCLFWNGIVSVFVFFTAAALYQNLIGPIPAWFPAPDFKPPPSLGMAAFMCCFLTPFVVVGSGLFGTLLLYGWGRIHVEISDDQALVSTGALGLAWRKRFDPNDVQEVKAGVTPWQDNGKHNELISIHADRVVKFGSMLTEERREWLRVVLQKLLVDTPASDRRQVVADLAGTPTTLE